MDVHGTTDGNKVHLFLKVFWNFHWKCYTVTLVYVFFPKKRWNKWKYLVVVNITRAVDLYWTLNVLLSIASLQGRWSEGIAWDQTRWKTYIKLYKATYLWSLSPKGCAKAFLWSQKINLLYRNSPLLGY